MTDVPSALPPDYTAVVERLPDAALLYDGGVLVHANAAAELTLRETGLLPTEVECSGRGASPADLAGIDLATVLVGDDVPTLHAAMRSAGRGEAVPATRIRFTDPSGAERVVSCVFSPLALRARTYVQVLAREVTDRVRREREVAVSERQFRALFENSPVGIAVTEERRFVLVNDALCRLLGRSRDDLVGRSADEVTHPEDLQTNDALASTLDSGQVAHARKRYVRPDGAVVWGALTAARIPGGDRRTIVQVRDVTEERHAAQRLEHLALHDPLTGLGNRTMLQDRLELLLAQRDAQRQGVAVLFVDLDGFKRINDALGHGVGDKVLKAVARRIRDVVRPADTVTRWGGDEFVVLLPELSGQPEALAIVDRMAAVIASPIPHRDDELVVTASIGIAFVPPGRQATATELLQQSDSAMYRAKQAAGNRHSVYDEGLRLAANRRSHVEGLLRRAVDSDRVVLHYQPIVDLRTRRTVGMEALLRLRDDDGRLLHPDSFLDIAEDTGLLLPIEHAVLLQAFEQTVRWLDAGHDLSISVNLCAKQVQGIDEFEDRLVALLGRTGLPADRLVVEVTEHALVDTGDRTVAGLHRLSQRGIDVSVDDFGTGYASMTYLQRLPVQEIKVDRRFVARVGEERPARAIVRAVAGLASDLGIRSVAEGIEDELQHTRILELGAQLGQGYLYARPAPADEVTEALEAGRAAAALSPR